MVLKTAIGLLALAIACWGFASRYLPVTNHIVLITAALWPLLMLCGPLAVVLLALAGRRLLLVIALAMTVAAVAVMTPLYRGSAAAHNETTVVRVISANLYGGEADPADFTRAAREQADVVAVQELTHDTVKRLADAGLDRTFGYRWLDPEGDASGAGLWSRYPMYDTKYIDGYSMAFLSARIRLPGSSIDPTILVVHLPGPWPQPIDGWRHDIARLPATLADVADEAGGGAVIVAGDFNSSFDMRPFRALLRNGYRDAAEQSGAGFRPTYPGHWRLPPLIAIDHILTRNGTATSLQTIRIPGSDHLGLVTAIAVGTREPNPPTVDHPG
jgi:endonuclease/exonuclease/phosphatase (EEP) superfamily protein YafD